MKRLHRYFNRSFLCWSGVILMGCFLLSSCDSLMGSNPHNADEVSTQGLSKTPLKQPIDMPSSGIKASVTLASSDNEVAKQTPVKQKKPAKKPDINPKDYKTLEWTDLIPEADLEQLLNPPEYLDEVVDGSAEDRVASRLKSSPETKANNAYEMALVSTNIIEKYDESLIRLPGFIVPLAFDDDMTVTEFFLVPYFGACLHMPPPPPNQIVYVQYPEGLTLENLYDPFWVSGYLTTDMVENNTATSAYSLAMHFFEPYTDLVDLDDEDYSQDELDFEEATE